MLSRSFSTISVGHLRFIVMDCPTPETLDLFASEMKVRGVSRVVRLCKPTYDAPFLEESVGITVLDLPFPDGGTPPAAVITSFLALVEGQFGPLANSLSKDTIAGHKVTIVDYSPVIAVHCVAGLGRAPLLVALALIEAGFAPIDAVAFIRKCRRGAFNALQLRYLMDVYKKRPTNSFSASGFANFLKNGRSSSPSKQLDSASISTTSSSITSGATVVGGKDRFDGDTAMAPASTASLPPKISFLKKMFQKPSKVPPTNGLQC